MNERHEIESTIVASLLQKPDLIEKLRVKPEMFTHDGMKSFIEYVFELGKVDHNEIYLKTTKDKTFLDIDTISNLYNSKFIGYGFFERYQQDLLNLYQIDKTQNVLQEFNSEPSIHNFDEMFNKLQKVSLISATEESGTKKIVDHFVEELYSEEPKQQINTGYKLMDYKIGGLEPTQLIVIAARPSVGKTGFALNMMLNIASQDYKTSFFSLETTGVSVLKRMLSAETGIELTRIKEIKDLEPDELTRLTTAADKILKLDIDIHDKSNITTHDVRKQAMKNKDVQQVIFIDYLQLMQTDSKLEHRNGIDKISRD